MKNKNAYTYKFNLITGNILSIVIAAILVIFTIFIGKSFTIDSNNISIIVILMFLYLMFHEVCHGIGYIIGGAKSKNIKYGICLEKGILYAMCMQEISKKNILISLQMPFMLIGVITYIIGIIFNIELLTFLSIVNIMGASLDLAMFFYILRLPKDIIYSESGENDEFVLISEEDLSKKKSIFFKMVKKEEYKKEKFIFKDFKRFEISKISIIIFVILLINCILLSIL